MAKLQALPDSEVRAANTGLVDFYLWKGIPVARRWPRFKPRTATPDEAAGQARFTVAAVATGAISNEMKELWRGLPTTGGTTWVDVFRATTLGARWLRDGN